MNIEKLAYLVEVAKTGSISEAAERMHVTISAISQAVSSLEKEWNVILFKRSKSGAVPTAEGSVILRKAYEVLAKYDELQEVAASFSNVPQGELRVATIPGPTPLMENALIDFKKDYPHIKMQMIEKGSQEIIEDISGHRSDVGFIFLFDKQLLENKGLHFERILQVKMVAAVSKSSPLALLGRLTPQDLAQQTLVLYNDDYVKWYMDEFQKQHGPVNVLFTTNYRESIVRAVHNQLAVTIGLDYSFAQNESFMRSEFAVLDLDFKLLEDAYLGLITSEGRKLPALAAHFIHRLKHELHQLRPQS